MIETWDRLCDLDEKQSAALSENFLKAQPALGVYLLAMTENMGKEAQQSPLIDLTMAVWDAMTRAAGKPLKSVSPEDLDGAEEANTGMLENLADASEVQWQDSVAGLVTSFNQREILGFCIEVLMRDDADQPELAPERIGLELLVLKTVIDCLDQ
jgi:hypothetical protein